MQLFSFIDPDFFELVDFFREKKILALNDEELSRLDIISKTKISQLTQREISCSTTNKHSFNALFIKRPILKLTDPIKVIILNNNLVNSENNNPYFSLELFLKFKMHDIDVSHLISLKSLEFVKNNINLDTSSYPLGKMLRFCFISQSRAEKLIATYVSTLKLLDYHHDIQKNALFIYSHAIKGLTEIKKLAKALKVAYHDNTVFALKRTIDFINYTFNTLYKKPDIILNLLDESTSKKKTILEFLSNESSLSDEPVTYVPRVIENTMVYLVNASTETMCESIVKEICKPNINLLPPQWL